MRRFLLLFTAAIIAVTCLPLSAMATGSLDKGQPEYAWVLTEVIDHENADKWAQADAHVASALSYSYSRGSYSASVTYEGGDPYKEGIKGTLGLQATFTGIPDVIYPDEPVSLGFSFTTTQNDTVKLSYTGSAAADFDQWDVGPGGATGRARWFANADGKDSFVLDVNGNPASYSETLTATLGAGSEGSRIALRTRFSLSGVPMGTNYVYEWKQVGGSAPSSDETPEPSSDEPSGWTPPVYHRPPPAPGLTEGICKIGDLHGEVNVRQNDEDDDAYIFAWSGMELYHNDRVKTLTRSGCIISFSDMSTFVMPEDTAIVLDIANERESKIALVAGNVWVNLKKMIQGGSMEVEMGQACAGIKGTTLICEENDGVSTVKVFEGTVEVTAKATGKSVMVSGGEMLSTDSAGKGTLTMFDMEAELAGWEPYVQQVTADAMEEVDRKSGGFPVIIVVVAAILLAVGAVVIVLIAKRNKRKEMVAPSYVASVQPGGQPSRRFCPNCGSPLSDSSKFCVNCGQRLQ